LLFHYKDARVHCAVLKKRAGPEPSPFYRFRSLVRAEEGCFRDRPFRTQQRAWASLLDSRFHSAGEPDSCTDEPGGSA
jgi:hypothetical protein